MPNMRESNGQPRIFGYARPSRNHQVKGHNKKGNAMTRGIQTNLVGESVNYDGKTATIRSVFLDKEGRKPKYTLQLEDGTLRDAYGSEFKLVIVTWGTDK